MGRKTNAARKSQAERLADVVLTDEAPEALFAPQPEEHQEPIAPPPEEQAEAPAPRTVVRLVYKRQYADRAIAAGLTDKVSKRGNGDWLQRELQAEVVGDKGAFLYDRFVAILLANGISPTRWEKWQTSGRGWEGRFRMSGSLLLRGVVGKTGIFRTPEGETNLVLLADGGDENAQAFLAKWAN